MIRFAEHVAQVLTQKTKQRSTKKKNTKIKTL